MGDRFFKLKIPGRGGGFSRRRGRGARRVFVANWFFLGGGGGLDIFFSGPKRPTSKRGGN